MESRLYTKYKKDVVPELKKEFGIKNDMALPRIVKVVLNVGVNSAMKDTNMFDVVVNNLSNIAGQKPVITKARKSISNFKIREGMNIGAKVTLRGQRMYEFLDKLINVTFPRMRDFRGVPKTIFDGRGNVGIGFSDQLAFPEIQAEGVERLHGLEVMIHTSSENDDQGYALLKGLGFPFQEEGDKN